MRLRYASVTPPHCRTQRDEVRRFAGFSRAPALFAYGRAVPQELVEDALLFGIEVSANIGFADLADERLVAIERLLDLQRVVGDQLGGGVDAGQAAANHDRGQPHLQVRQRIALERAGELQRHQEVAGLADAANQVVPDVDDGRTSGAGGDGDVIDAVGPRFLERQRAAEADAAVDPELLAARERQVDQREEVLVPADGDAVLRDAAEALEHAVVERAIDLAPLADRAAAARRPRR